MILYLKFNNFLKRVPEITLHKCFIPKIAEVTETRVEPAIWFKVLMLDSMLVDCDSKKVYWTGKSLPQQSNFNYVDESLIPVEGILDYFSTQERLFDDMECYDYDPFVDELFDMATDIARQYLQGQLNSDPQVRILQLLHCFILPKIKLKKTHMQYLEVALKLVDKELREVEENIQHKDNAKRNMENSLRKQREKMMQTDDFTKELFVATCNREFLDFFLTHIIRDVKKSNEKLVLLQDEIDNLRSSSIEEKQQILTDIRKKRNLEYDEIIKLQTVRETIKNVIGRPHVKRKKRKLPKKTQDSILFQEIYVEISRRYQNDISDIHGLLLSKLKMHSVREAIYITIEELNEEGESFGYHHKLGSSEIDTDIFDQNQRPTEWLTLEEKVQNLFDLNHDGFQSKFEKFCESVIDKCQQVIAERNMFGGLDVTKSIEDTGTFVDPDGKMECGLPVTPTSLQLLNVMGRASQCRRSYDSQSVTSHSSINSRIDSLALSQGIPQEALEGITKSIMENLTEMSKDIAVEISENEKISRTLVNKMYISYERRVAEKLMPKLAELYTIKFESNIQSLRKWLAHVTLADIGIDDTVVQKLMAPKKVPSVHILMQETGSLNEEETMVKHPSQSEDDWHHESQRSLRLRKCSLTTLYEYVDRDCQDMPEFFENSPLVSNQDIEVQINSSEGSESSEFLENSVGLSESPVSQGSLTVVDETNNFHQNLNKMDSHDNCGEMQKLSNPSEEPYVQMRFTNHNHSQNVHEQNCPSHADEIKVTDVNGEKIYVEMRFPTHTSQQDDRHQPHHYDTVVINGNGEVPAYSSVSPMYQNFVSNFDKFEGLFSKLTSSVSVFKKLRHITKAIRYTEEQLREIREKNGDSSPVMSDDLLTTIIILLIRMNPKLMLHLYAHLNLVIALLPQFMAGNAHDYALVTLYSAFQYLNDQFALHKTRQA
ncbi:hypothetical protein CHS0354_031756 [Potamilus streckersoni]|uniref:VPS9 domain-containing protein n=1 Tax=Potamilus streckersoni TaxID=2493646 RepID=A0AAE0RXD2_9BIVA|nr:hypothetical protein CHS0354_031756 [Potamilus streckersoni]